MLWTNQNQQLAKRQRSVHSLADEKCVRLKIWSIRPVVSLYRQQGEQAVKAGGFERLFQPNLPIAVQEIIIIFVSEGGWGSVKQEHKRRECQ